MKRWSKETKDLNEKVRKWRMKSAYMKAKASRIRRKLKKIQGISLKINIQSKKMMELEFQILAF